MNLLATVRTFISRHQLLPPNAPIVVGVSGGPDSLVLLHLLRRIAPACGWQLHVAHLHHGLRPEADDEARFVAGVAADWGLGCTVQRVAISDLAASEHLSIEEAARQARYTFLGQTARSLGAAYIAVGHHADDQVETVLMHLLRGSGLAGLRGMTPDTRLSALHLPQAATFDGIHLVRPLLPVGRDVLAAYARAQGLQPRHDASNDDESFFRNHLRHSIIPMLRTINPRLDKTFWRTTQALQGDYDLLQARTLDLWQDLAQVQPGRIRFSLHAFRSLLPAEQRALLRRAISALRPQQRNLAWEHSERLLSVLAADPKRASGGPFTLTSRLVAWLSYQWLEVQEPDFAVTDAPQVQDERPMPLPGQLSLGQGWSLTAQPVQWQETPPWQQRSGRQRVWLPWQVATPLRVRPRRAGERIMLPGAGAYKALKDVMNDLKIPRALRWQWPLLVDAQDEILWIVGHRAGARTWVDATASRAWELSLVSPES